MHVPNYIKTKKSTIRSLLGIIKFTVSYHCLHTHLTTSTYIVPHNLTDFSQLFPIFHDSHRRKYPKVCGIRILFMKISGWSLCALIIATPYETFHQPMVSSSIYKFIISIYKKKWRIKKKIKIRVKRHRNDCSYASIISLKYFVA